MHCVNDEVCSIWGPNGIIEGGHVMGKHFREGVGDVAGSEASDGCGDAERTKF